LTKSVQLSGWHVPLQTWLRQSAGTVHFCPEAQRAGQDVPPQSTPASSWLLTASVQVAV